MINVKYHGYKTKRIDAIAFGLMDQKTILKQSVLYKDNIMGIESPDSYEHGEPKIGSLLDERMGVVEHSRTCETCGLDIHKCPGHFGHIMLTFPVHHINLFPFVHIVLNCICKCGKLFIKNDAVSEKELKEIIKYNKGMKRLKAIKKSPICANAKYCTRQGGCGRPKPKIEQEDKPKIEILEKYITVELDKEDGRTKEKVTKFVLTPLDCYNRLKRISDEDCVILGFNPYLARPEDMIFTVLPVPPTPVRPSARTKTGIREDHLTIILSGVVKINNRLNKMIKQEQQLNPDNEKLKQYKDLLQINAVNLIDNSVSGIIVAYDRSNLPFKSISSRLKGKHGRIRLNLMGKRVNFSSRSVITGDPNIGINELGIPSKIAMHLTKPVKVTKDNIDYMKTLVKRGHDKYPGANIIIYGNKNIDMKQGSFKDLRFGKEKTDLRIGDTVERHLQDGDIVLFNRHPSLHKYSMMGHYAKIIDDPNLLTFRLNVLTTSPYNAD